VVGHPVDHVFVPVRAGRRESMVLRWVRSECAFSAAYHRRKENRSLPLHNCISYTRNVCAIEQRGDHRFVSCSNSPARFQSSWKRKILIIL